MTRAALSLLTEEAVCVGMAVVPMLGALSCSQRGSLALRVCVSQLRAPRSGGAELPKPGTLGESQRRIRQQTQNGVWTGSQPWPLRPVP